MQALWTQTGTAFVTPVVQPLPQAPQLFASLVSSTQVPLHAEGAVAGQPLTHVEFEHTGVEPVQALPQLPQFAVLFRSVHVPLQRFVPVAQTVVQAPATQAGWVLGTLVVQTLPHVRQLFGSLTVSTQAPEQVVAALEGQVATHAWVPLSGAHTGVVPLHTVPQVPQLDALVVSPHPPLGRDWRCVDVVDRRVDGRVTGRGVDGGIIGRRLDGGFVDRRLADRRLAGRRIGDHLAGRSLRLVGVERGGVRGHRFEAGDAHATSRYERHEPHQARCHQRPESSNPLNATSPGPAVQRAGRRPAARSMASLASFRPTL